MNVHAVLIGIEQYDCRADNIDLDLDGPASDAVRFAGWMLQRGVPPENLHCFVNALDLPARQTELRAFPRGDEVQFHPPHARPRRGLL